MKKHCDYCHKALASKAHPFTLRLELFPAVEPSLEIQEDELERDLEQEMKRLIELMEQMDEAAVTKQEKLMFVSHSFTLCRACRDTIARKLDWLGGHKHN